MIEFATDAARAFVRRKPRHRIAVPATNPNAALTAVRSRGIRWLPVVNTDGTVSRHLTFEDLIRRMSDELIEKSRTPADNSPLPAPTITEFAGNSANHGRHSRCSDHVDIHLDPVTHMAKATILVVDDEALIRWSLCERLKSEGFDVLEADSGRAALERLSEGVDLVLLDFRLPDTDGLTILGRIKEFDQDILVILLTAYANVETAVEAMKLGAYHFAHKPFNLDEVAATVERALETTRLRREVRQFRTNAARPYSAAFVGPRRSPLVLFNDGFGPVAAGQAFGRSVSGSVMVPGAASAASIATVRYAWASTPMRRALSQRV
jgi:CheY-like chemotaxis protein